MMSRRITSGRSRLMRLRPASPSVAEAVSYPARSSSTSSESRMCGSSSTMSTRGFAMAPAPERLYSRAAAPISVDHRRLEAVLDLPLEPGDGLERLLEKHPIPLAQGSGIDEIVGSATCIQTGQLLAESQS